MPTTEIISVGSMEGPYTKPYTKIRHSCDSELNSHRDLFQDVLDRLVGTMVHIDSRDDTLEDSSLYFLGGDHYIDNLDNDEENYRFGYNPDTFSEIYSLASDLTKQSPTNHIIFLTDFQGGPEERNIITVKDLEEFKELNQRKETGSSS